VRAPFSKSAVSWLSLPEQLSSAYLLQILGALFESMQQRRAGIGFQKLEDALI